MELLFTIGILIYVLIAFSTNVHGQLYCPEGWEGDDDNCYWFSQALATRQQATSNCTSMHDSHLVTVNTPDIHEYLTRDKGVDYEFWIGIFVRSDLALPYNWFWSDGTPTLWTKWDQPGTTQACVRLLSSDGRWETYQCTVPQNFVCKKQKLESAPCEDNWTENNGFCYIYSSLQLNNMRASRHCIDEYGATLTSVYAEEENNFLQTFITNDIWIGLFPMRWEDNQRYNWHFWDLTGPLVQLPCVRIDLDGFFKASFCDSVVHRYVCQTKAILIPTTEITSVKVMSTSVITTTEISDDTTTEFFTTVIPISTHGYTTAGRISTSALTTTILSDETTTASLSTINPSTTHGYTTTEASTTGLAEEEVTTQSTTSPTTSPSTTVTESTTPTTFPPTGTTEPKPTEKPEYIHVILLMIYVILICYMITVLLLILSIFVYRWWVQDQIEKKQIATKVYEVKEQRKKSVDYAAEYNLDRRSSSVPNIYATRKMSSASNVSNNSSVFTFNGNYDTVERNWSVASSSRNPSVASSRKTSIASARRMSNNISSYL